MEDMRLEDLNVLSEETLITPEQLRARAPVPKQALATVAGGRLAIKRILSRRDPRLVLVVGPCSIHDPKAAMDYAVRLAELAGEVKDTLLLVMRVYFEKPRTTTGWKGYVNDPHLNDSFDIGEGLHRARQLLTGITTLGVPTATEALDPVTPQYLQELICWSAIGARTTESQTHREMASGLSSAVGFKNGTDGNLEVAINAMQSVSAPHRFLGINHQGVVSIIRTRGNAHAHIVLRGGNAGPNYDAASIADCERRLEAAGVPTNIMIDCSHANSDKDPARQPVVMEDVARQINNGNRSIIGLMLESNIEWGNQTIPQNPADLRYGVSVTDACIDWPTTERVIRDLRRQVKDALHARKVELPEPTRRAS